MTLENLLKTGQLKPHDPDAAEIRRLLEAARRNLKDSAATSISPENRFDAAYKASCNRLSLHHGKRFHPGHKRPGHHVTTLQSLPKTIGIEGDRMQCWTCCGASATSPTIPAKISTRGRSRRAAQRRLGLLGKWRPG